MQDQNQAAAELTRVSSDMLPSAITTVAHVTLLAGLVLIFLGFMKGMPWAIAPGITSVLAAPFLYGFADMVLSLRSLVRKSLS